MFSWHVRDVEIYARCITAFSRELRISFKNIYEVGLIILLKKTDLNLVIYW